MVHIISDSRPVGFVNLPSGRTVFWTGKIAIGLRAGEQMPAWSATQDADRIQDALLTR